MAEVSDWEGNLVWPLKDGGGEKIDGVGEATTTEQRIDAISHDNTGIQFPSYIIHRTPGR